MEGIRPIVIGEIIIRVTIKTLEKVINKDVMISIGSVQRIGLPDACEAAIKDTDTAYQTEKRYS